MVPRCVRMIIGPKQRISQPVQSDKSVKSFGVIIDCVFVSVVFYALHSLVIAALWIWYRVSQLWVHLSTPHYWVLYGTVQPDAAVCLYLLPAVPLVPSFECSWCRVFFFRGCRVLRMSTSHISTTDLHKRPMFGRSVAIYYFFCLLSVI